ncbi:MAG: SAM-dependent methyltransferase, partial [Neolewinella sp.]
MTALRGMLCAMSRPLPNLTRITRLREMFLEERRGKRALDDYWRDPKDVEAYDAVLAERIGWKWDAALAECLDRGFERADKQVVLDYGCGSGIAVRKFAAHFGAGEVLLYDRSMHAMNFAAKRIAIDAPKLKARPIPSVNNVSPDVLLVSHVLGELDDEGNDELRALISRSKRVIIVEPGNRRVSRRLSKLRDELLDSFHVQAPCPHQGSCPSLIEHNDWCHFFATPPPEVFTDGYWARVARELNIDLRALPFAFVALVNKTSAIDVPDFDEDERLLGRADIQKHFAQMRCCTEEGITMVEITKRHHAKLWRSLKKRPEQIRFALRDRDAPPVDDTPAE